MSGASKRDPSTDEDKVLWAASPHSQLHAALDQRKISGALRSQTERSLRTLRGPLRVQSDSQGRRWLAIHPPVVEAYRKLYRALGLLPSDLSLDEVLKHYGLLHVAISVSLASTNISEADLTDASGAPELINAVAGFYQLDGASFERRWREAYIGHALDFCHGLEQLSPPGDADTVKRFLELSTELLASRSADPDASALLSALAELWRSGGHFRARRAVLTALAKLDAATGDPKRPTRLRRLALKSAQKQQALTRLEQAIGRIAQGFTDLNEAEKPPEAGRRLNRRPTASARIKKRHAKTRQRLRSRRLAQWSASSIHTVPSALRPPAAKLPVESSPTTRGRDRAAADKTKGTRATTGKTKGTRATTGKTKDTREAKPRKTAKDVKTMTDAQRRAKKQAAAKRRRAKAKDAEGAGSRRAERQGDSRRNRRAQIRARQRSRRLMSWSVSGADMNVQIPSRPLVPDAKPVANWASPEQAPATTTPPAKPKARRGARRAAPHDAKRRDPKKASKRRATGAEARGKRRRKTRTTLKSRELANWSASQEMPALDAELRAKLAARLEGVGVKAKPAGGDKGVVAKPRPSRGKAKSKGKDSSAKRKRARGRRDARAGKAVQARGEKLRRKTRSVARMRKSQRLTTWSASQEMPAFKPEDLGEPAVAALIDSPSKDPVIKPSSAERARRQRSSTPQGPQQLVIRLAAGVGVLLLLTALIQSFDFGADERAALKRAVAKLDRSSGGQGYEKLRNRIESFKNSRGDANDHRFANDLLDEIEDHAVQIVKTLDERGAKLVLAALETNEEQREAERLQLSMGAWKNVDDRLEDRIVSLGQALTAGREFATLGQDLLELAAAAARPCPVDLHATIAQELEDDGDRDLPGLFDTRVKALQYGAPGGVFKLLEDGRYAPLFEGELYRKLEAKMVAALRTPLNARRAELCRLLKRRAALCAKVADDYLESLGKCNDQLEALDLAAAIDAFLASPYAKERWHKISLAWLASPEGAAYVEQLKPSPEEGPVVADVPKEVTPEVTPEVEKKKPVEKTRNEDKRNYKEAFAALLGRYTKAGKGEKSVLTDEMGKLMKEASELVGDSPAMAFDVVAFFKKRYSKFKREPSLKAAYRAQVAASFAVLLPRTTGPAGFWRLRDWCKETDFKEGTEELAPILARLRPPEAGNGVFQRQFALRKKRAQVATAVEGFLGQRRVENVKSFKKLISWLRKEGVKADAVRTRLETALTRIVAKVGKDKALADRLLASYDRIPERELSDKHLEKLTRTFDKRCEKLSSNAENTLIEGIKRALSAKEPAVGYDIMQQALIVNPSSERVYKALKYRLMEDGSWLRPWDADMRKRGLVYDDDIGWYKGDKEEGKYYLNGAWKDLAEANQRHAQGGDPWVLESEHFTLRSHADLTESQLVLRRLEAFYLQLFRQFDLFFAPNGNAMVVFGLTKMKPMVVNYYRSRAQFKELADPPTDWAAGFYSGGRRASFFYSTPGDWTVLQHEVVHQILGENSGGGSESWLAEGTAVYMENAFFDREGTLELGGVREHRRPYRYLMEAREGRTTISFDEVLALKTGAQWGAGNVSDHYKGAGSVVYFFMTFDGGRYRGDFLDYLRTCYNRGAARDLPHYFGLSLESLAWLCERFYKQGFAELNGAFTTHEEKERFDREVIARLYPEPAKGGKKKRVDDPEIASLMRTLSSNPSVSRRRQAAEALASLGEDGQAALSATLDKLVKKATSSVEKHMKSKRSAYRQKMAAEILKRRKEALDFINDPSKYPDENHGKAAQPQVDALVNALRAAYADPFAVLRVDAGKLKDLLDVIERYQSWRGELLGDTESGKKEQEALGKRINDGLAMDKIALSPQDAQVQAVNKDILAYNKRTKSLMNDEERACCEATNEYRMLYGLKIFKFFDPLVRAARGHSAEMQKLGFFDHNSPTPANRTPAMRVGREGARYSGENIAMGHPSGRAAFRGWYNSSGHHRNMLAKHLSIGVGQAARYWTQNFGRDNPQ